MKRASIADLAPRKATVAPAPLASEVHAPQADAPEMTKPAGRQPPYKAILSKVDDRTHRQMKILAVNEGVPIGDLQVEAINLLFRSRGLPEIAKRVTPDETGRDR